jgi:hypothetical protein
LDTGVQVFKGVPDVCLHWLRPQGSLAHCLVTLILLPCNCQPCALPRHFNSAALQIASQMSTVALFKKYPHTKDPAPFPQHAAAVESPREQEKFGDV